MEPSKIPHLSEDTRNRLIAFATRIMHQQIQSRLDPEDIVQSVLMSLCRSRNAELWALPEDELAKLLLRHTWLHTIKNNAKHKRERRDVRAEAGVVGDPLTADESAIDPADQAAVDELVALLSAKLSETESAIWFLHLRGFEKLKIAKCVGVGVRTVDRALHHARVLLLEAFELKP
jgi:DNA-directed RNA polymerase specialized sigma24 family protein